MGYKAIESIHNYCEHTDLPNLQCDILLVLCVCAVNDCVRGKYMLKEVEAKKTARVEAVQRETARRNKREVDVWSRRMEERENEAKMREHQQRLKQLSVRASLLQTRFKPVHSCVLTFCAQNR